MLAHDPSPPSLDGSESIRALAPAQVYTDDGVAEDSVRYVRSRAVTYSSILSKVFVMLEHAAATGARWLLKTDDDAYVNIPQTVQARSVPLAPQAHAQACMPLPDCVQMRTRLSTSQQR